MNLVTADTAGNRALRSRLQLAVNFAAFQCGWFACVLGAANGWPWAGTTIAIGIVALHSGFAARPMEELKLAASAVALGVVCDSVLVSSGWIGFKGGQMMSGLAPGWILALWALFATTLNASLRWLKGRPVLAVSLGAVVGPLSYVAGVKLGAVALVEPASGYAALVVEWAVAMPVLMALADRFNGVQPVAEASAA
jgi:hypothetical protein